VTGFNTIIDNLAVAYLFGWLYVR